MFWFKKKTTDNKPKNPKLILHTDIHSHLIHGVDDGAQTIDDSLSMIKNMAANGYDTIYTTPHIKSNIFRNTPGIILEKFSELDKKVKELEIPVKLGVAAEYFIDMDFIDLLNSDTPLLTLPGNFLLIEISMHEEPMLFLDTIFKIQSKGYIPILAHPERYTFYGKKTEKYSQLKKAGCLFQLNLLSLTGYYGNTVKKLAEFLIEKKLIDLAGTDIHNGSHCKILSSQKNFELISDYKFKNDTLFV